MGSMFKNPAGDKAGRLIEAAGLKGKRIGNASISTQHANFFINEHGDQSRGHAQADRTGPQEVFWINLASTLELEVELIGEW